MKTIKVFKTHTFKIHNLSARKAKLIDKSMLQSKMAFYKAIHSQKMLAESLIDKDKKEKKIGLSLIKKEVAKLVKPLPFGNAIKASTIEDAAAQLSSYIELTEIGQNAALPCDTDREVDYQFALNALLSSTTKEQENLARDEMNRALKGERETLSFYKYRASDGFLLLSDVKGRLFAFINLWSAKDKRSTPIAGEFIDVRTGELIKLNTKTGLLLPLECSKWHEAALKSGASKSAKLYKRDGEYFLAVSVEYSINPVECKTVMGVDRGIDEIASYVVRDSETGKILEKGNLSGVALREHQRRFEDKQRQEQRLGRKFTSAFSNYTDNLMHHLANAIVEVAERHSSLVVLEDLSAIKNGHHHTRTKGTRRTNFARMLSRQQYGKLEFLLGYKLQMVGLQKPRAVHAAYTSLTCPCCGHASKENRPERAIFICESCGYKEHADLVGGINIAGKQLWLSAVGKEIKGKALSGKYEHLRFNVWQSENLTV